MEKVIAIIEDEFEDLELTYPVLRMKEAGYEVDVVGKEVKTYKGKHGVPFASNKSFAEVKAQDYVAMLIPGGWAPDKLRRYPEVISLVKQMNSDNKVIGIICHAGWVTISADVIRNKKITSTPGIKDDMTNAGGIWLDQEVVVDQNIVSSRKPADLPAYMKAFIKLLNK